MKFQMSVFDAQGLAFGIAMTSLSVVLLKSAELVTGQTAGIALLLSYVLPLDFGLLFFLIGIPFLVLAWVRRGVIFAIRTIIAVVGISVVSQFLLSQIQFAHLPVWAAAILGGACSGMGLIAIFRHNASAGGMTILAIILVTRNRSSVHCLEAEAFDGG